MKQKSKSGQTWIETVLYTLIGLALIAAVLVFVTPKISESQDRLVIEQSINSMNVLDAKMQGVISSGSGNVGVIPDFTLKKGYLSFDGTNQSITLVLENLKLLYSEPGIPIYNGRVRVVSLQGQNSNSVNLTLAYNMNIKYNSINQVKIFTAAPTPYKFSISNINNQYINISEVL